MAALTDPGTPGPVLATLATVNVHEFGAHLLAHPNTPTDVAANIPEQRTDAVAAAMWSPTLTDTTRVRLAAHLRDNELRDLAPSPYYPIGGGPHPAPEHRATRPWVYPEVARRALAADVIPFDRAVTVCTHPAVPAATRVELLHAILDHRHVIHADSVDIDTIVYAIMTHPDDFDVLYQAATKVVDRARAAGDHCITAQGLTRDLDAVRRSPDRLAAHIANVKAELADGGGFREIAAARRAPDPAFVTWLCARQQRSESFHRSLAFTASLYGSHPWVRVMFRHNAGDMSALTDLDPAVLDADVAAARYGVLLPNNAGISLDDLTNQPLHTTSTVMGLVVAALGRPHRDDAHRATNALRLALHPNTPPARTRKLLERARRRRAGDALADAHGDARTLLRTLPLPHLQDATHDEPIGRYLAYHARDLARALWTNPDLARTALTLEPQFPGTIPELLATADAITT